MTVFVVLVALAVAAVVRHLWAKDITARLNAEADARELRDRLDQSYRLREWEAAQAAQQLREVTAIALHLDIKERTS